MMFDSGTGGERAMDIKDIRLLANDAFRVEGSGAP
jgi:hypothetical protein